MRWLAASLTTLTGEPWEGRVHAALPGHPLPLYQAAVAVEDAAAAFAALLKPMKAMKAASPRKALSPRGTKR